MTACTHDCAALACTPEAIPSEERAAHFALIRRLFGELAAARSDIPGGYAYRFPADALEPVARFVANERKCCPFLSFEISIAANSGQLWLRLAGPDGTRAILDAELTASAAPPAHRD